MTFFWLWCLLGIQNPTPAYANSVRQEAFQRDVARIVRERFQGVRVRIRWEGNTKTNEWRI